MMLAEDLMRTVRVRAQSPDGTVTAMMTAEAGISVRFEPGSIGSHRVRSLNAAVSAALTGAVDGFQRAGQQVLDREQTPDEQAAAWDSEAGRKLRPMLDALDKVDVRVVSPREFLTVGLRGGKLGAAFDPYALELREDVLAAEIDVAVRKAYDRRSAVAERLYAELVTHGEASA